MDFLKNAADSVSNAASASYSAAKDGVTKVADVTTSGVSAGLNAAKDGVSKVGDATASGLNAAKDGVSKVGDATASGLNSVKDGASSVGGGFGSFTAINVLKAETKAKVIALSPLQAMKVGRIIKNMQESDLKFSDDEVDLVVKALYVSQSDEDFKAAFDMLDSKLSGGNAGGRLTATSFRAVLPLVGEDIPAEQIDTLFKEVDADGSGTIEFDEFKRLMLAMNPPKDSVASSVFTGITGGVTGFASGLGSTFTTLTVLKANTKAKLMAASPLALARIGRIIKNMQASEFKFNDDEVDDVVRAVYVTQNDEDFQKVFDMFDVRLNGSAKAHLTAESFRKVLPLVGEDIAAERIDKLFKEVDTDGSGLIEFAEFKAMMLSIANKEA